MEEAKANVVHLFYSYAHSDLSLRNELEKHLSLLRQQGYITQWHNRDISAGTDWKQQINSHLDLAHIILLLISADFLASEYCYSTEMKRALNRHHEGTAHVIPILLRPVDWRGAPFAVLQLLPRNGKPVTRWPNRDSAFEEIAIEIRAIVTTLHKSQAFATANNPPQTSARRLPEQNNLQAERKDAEKVPTFSASLSIAADHLRQYYRKVSELKSVHNMLHEIECQLEGLTSTIQVQLLSSIAKERKPSLIWPFIKRELPYFSVDISIIDISWQQVRQKIDDLKYFAAVEMEALGEDRFLLDSDTMHGPLWITEICTTQKAFETSRQEQDMKEMNNHAYDLLRKSRSHLFLIDKQLLKAIKELDVASDHVLRNIP